MRQKQFPEWLGQSLLTAGVTSLSLFLILNNRSELVQRDDALADQGGSSQFLFKGREGSLQAQADPYFDGQRTRIGGPRVQMGSSLAASDGRYQGEKTERSKHPYGVCMSADLLYWKANEDGLEYGTKMVAGPILGQASKTKTKLLDLNFEWNAGFRLGLGYKFQQFDNWALGLEWTRMRSQAHGHSHAKGIESQAGGVNTIIPTWVNLVFELRAGASQAKTSWHLDYDTLDLGLGRNVNVGKHLAMRPFLGVRAGWIDQRYLAKYKTNFLLGEGQTPFPRVVTFEGKNDFAGFGVRGGSGFVWHLSRNWNIFGNLNGSLLYGQFHVSMKNKNDQGLGEGEIDPMPLDFTAREEFWRVRLNFEESLGLGWEVFFKKNRYHLAINTAYELSQWLSQNELFYTLYFRGQDTISSVPIRNQGNLGFQGVRAGIQFDF
ncbi:MAG: Lpg1974 family pore-forming outer membrane protein [Chlamydiota bacterium]